MQQPQPPYNLIEGVFDPDRAMEILMALINHKINYHTLEIMSMEERGLGTSEHSQRRILDLKNTGKEVRSLIRIASEQKLKLHIHSSIEITLTE